MTNYDPNTQRDKTVAPQTPQPQASAHTHVQKPISAPPVAARRRRPFDWARFFTGLIGWLITPLVLGPLYIVLVNAFKSRKQIFRDQLGVPEVWNSEYIVEAARKMDYWRALFNSLKVVAFSIVFIILIASLAAWALERRKTRASRLLFGLFISTMLIPFQAVMIPLIQYFYRWNFQIGDLKIQFLNSHYGLIFMNIGFGLSMAIFLYHGFVQSIPIEMEESAQIDGASRFQTFRLIIFPNLQAISMTVAIINVISYWNDYLLPSLVLQKPSLRTLPLSTFFFFGEFNIQWNMAMGGLLLTIIPVILFYFLAQEYIIEGVMAGAVKG